MTLTLRNENNLAFIKSESQQSVCHISVSKNETNAREGLTRSYANESIQ